MYALHFQMAVFNCDFNVVFLALDTLSILAMAM